ncbi:MAG: hypothetical protein ACI9JN_000894 [Bacteroidia bacterium]|jgi:hypothetical protein
MKTTNNHHIIKEKLQGVDLPDMGKSWAKMEQAMETTPPVHGGWSYFIGKYKLYLNLFIATLTIGVVGLYVKSKTNPQGPVYLNSIEQQSGIHSNYLHVVSDIDHTDDLPTPTKPFEPTILMVNMPEHSKHVLPSRTKTKPVAQTSPVLDNSANNLVEEPEPDEMSYPDVTVMQAIDDYFDLTPYQHIPVRYVKNQVGFKIQTGTFLGYSPGSVFRNTGAAIFARRFVNTRSALHVELGYNPVLIRPITYVEGYNVFNNFNYTQKDSAEIKALKYVTIPVNLYVQLSPDISINAGPQISFLTGLSGDVTSSFNYPGAPESGRVEENTRISNRGGFASTDIGLNIEVNMHFRRFEVGFRMQQSLGDYSTNQLSTQKHRFSTLQFKLGCLLND